MPARIFISIILATSFCGAVFPQEILFQDDFESYTVGSFPSSPWIMRWDGNDSSSQIIVNNRSVSGSQSLKLEGAPGWAAVAEITLPFMPQVIYSEGYMMVERNEDMATIGFTNPEVGTWGFTYAVVIVGSKGKIICDNPNIHRPDKLPRVGAMSFDDHEFQTCEANKWYHIKIKYRRYSENFDVWINGVLKGQNITWDATGEHTSFQIATRHPEKATRVWFDDVKVYADSLTMMSHIYFKGLYLKLTGNQDTAKVLIRKALTYLDINPDFQKPRNHSFIELKYLDPFFDDHDSAIFYKQRAFNWYYQHGHLLLAMYISNELGFFFYQNNELNIAEKHFLQSEILYDEMKYKNAWYRPGSEQDSSQLNTELIYPLNQSQMKEMILILGKLSYEKLYLINEKKNRFEKALYYFKAYTNVCDSLSKFQIYCEQAYLNPKRSGIDEKIANQDAVFSLRQEIYQRDNRLRQSIFLLVSLATIVLLVGLLTVVFIRQNKLRNEQQNLLLQQKLFRSQMNPHFIFNSLSGIHHFILHAQPSKAASYLSRFSKLMRSILHSSVEEYISLEDERATLENYLELQKIRFPDKFDFTVEMDERLDPGNISIPGMITQPFVENALEHGIKDKSTRGLISVRFIRTNGMIRIEVEDNGIGRAKAQELSIKRDKDHRSLSTAIINERIKTLNKNLKKKITFDVADLVNERGEPSGTKVILEVPLQ